MNIKQQVIEKWKKFQHSSYDPDMGFSRFIRTPYWLYMNGCERPLSYKLVDSKDYIANERILKEQHSLRLPDNTEISWDNFVQWGSVSSCHSFAITNHKGSFRRFFLADFRNNLYKFKFHVIDHFK